MSVSITVQDLRVVFSSISRNEEHIQKPASLTCERAVAPPQIARMAAEHATNDQVVCIEELCDESERLAEAGEDYSAAADTAFHNAIAESSGNLVVPRLMGVLKASVPLFIDVTGKKLVEETIRTHRDVADAIASRNPTAAHDAMYLHLVYNRNMIAEGAEAKGI